MKYKVTETEIDGKTVKTTVYPARRGLALKVRLARILLPLIGGADTKDIDATKIAEVLLNDLTEKNVETLIFDIFMSTYIDEKDASDPALFDIVFAGDYAFLFQTVKYVLEVNYGSFLALIGLTGNQSKDKNIMSLSPKSNNG